MHDGGVITGSLPQETNVDEITRQLANLVLGPADAMLGADGQRASSALLEFSDGLPLGPVGPPAGTAHTDIGSEPELECFHEVLHDPLEAQLEVSFPTSPPAVEPGVLGAAAVGTSIAVTYLPCVLAPAHPKKGCRRGLEEGATAGEEAAAEGAAAAAPALQPPSPATAFLLKLTKTLSGLLPIPHISK